MSGSQFPVNVPGFSGTLRAIGAAFDGRLSKLGKIDPNQDRWHTAELDQGRLSGVLDGLEYLGDGLT